jgi:hypothetical protein
MRAYVVTFFRGPNLEINPTVVCEKVFSDTSEKNLVMSGMQEFDIARAKLMIPPIKHKVQVSLLKWKQSSGEIDGVVPVEVPTMRSNISLIGQSSSPIAL